MSDANSAGRPALGGHEDQIGTKGEAELPLQDRPENPGSEAGNGAPEPVETDIDPDTPLRDGHNPEPDLP
jgi:hypothetical protein